MHGCLQPFVYNEKRERLCSYLQPFVYNEKRERLCSYLQPVPADSGLGWSRVEPK